MNKSHFLLTICMLASSYTCLQGQTTNPEYDRAEKLRRSYNFEEASKIYKTLLNSTNDPNFINTLTIQIARSENGAGMLEYAAKPVYQGHHDVSKKDFMLFIPDQGDHFWAPLPSILGSSNNGKTLLNFVYTNDSESTIYFSALHKEGHLDLYKSTKINDTLWHAPEPLGNLINSAGDEILPVISADGKELYFASNGQYGMGGFDLYVCQLDEVTGEWGVPQNLGFPYSSPADDYLFINDTERSHSYLVSNRSIFSSDSVRIYRLAFEVNPVKAAIEDPQEALKISLLLPQDNKEIQEEREPENVPDSGDYPSLVREVRKIQMQIDSTIKNLDLLRSRFSLLSNTEDRSSLEREITSGEIYVSEMRDKLRIAGKAVQEKEIEFLNKGVLIPRETIPVPDAEKQTPSYDEFIIEKSNPGKIVVSKLFFPEEPADYTFRIEEQSTIYEEAPENGLAYRIQLAVAVNKADKKVFKGISPVFETKTATGKWLYTAGHFNRYAEASSALGQVKGRGFRNAIIVAYDNGKSINVKNARLEEGKISETTTYQIKISGYPDELPASVLATIRALTEKDIAKRLSATGETEYYIGPFSNKTEASDIERALITAGTTGVTVEDIIKPK